MCSYVPSYSISERMPELVLSISEKICFISGWRELEAKPRLRRINGIRSVHASLKIEANSLSLSEVRDVLNGQLVLGDREEIREVKNAYDACSRIGKINPFSMSELKKIHGIMTSGIIADFGDFRRGGEGIFSGGRCIFAAPPAQMVNGLMREPLSWLKCSEGKIYPLISSAVFHYEFVFIHPFADGNGRMARLWHIVILARWKQIFEYIPLESQIEKFQEAYYAAIAQCHAEG